MLGNRIQSYDPAGGICIILTVVTIPVTNHSQDLPEVLVGMKDEDMIVIGPVRFEEKKPPGKWIIPVSQNSVHVWVPIEESRALGFDQ
jgi:hypothetical protein